MAYYTELRSPYTFGPVPSPTYKSKEDGYPGGSEYLQRMNQPEINAMLQYMDAQELNDPSAVLRRKLKTPPTPSLEEDPITVLRRNTDRARNYPRESSEMFSPSFNPEGDIINFRRMNTDRARNYQRDSDYLPGKQTPPSMGPPPSTGNVLLPARTQTSAAQPESAPAQGLLDTEDTPESGTSWYDDPMRMGLLQAGLGLLSAPQYSTNPNDVTLGSALAKGLGGFVQGYGTTKKRLSEAERQKLEDDYKRSQIEFDKLYKTALTNEAIGRTEQMKNLLAKPAKDQEEWEAKVREIYPNPDNKTGQALIAAGPVEGAKKLAKLAGGMTETERTGLVSKIKNDTVLSADDKTMLLEMVSERDYEGKLSNSTAAITQVINQIKDDLKPPTESKGDALERAEDILITAEPGSTDIRVSNAFDRIYSKELGENRTFNANTNREEVTKIYPVIPQEIEKKFPELVARRRQLEQGQSVKPPSLSQQQEENRAAALEAYHNEIVENNYDQPEPGYSFQGLRESISPRLASDEYLLKIRAQDRWIENVLRAASGAAIAKDEYADKRAQYFPEPGEGQAAVKAKRRARDIELQKAKLNLANQMEQARKQEALPKVEVEDPDAYLLE
jgi:hypothetical protein